MRRVIRTWTGALIAAALALGAPASHAGDGSPGQEPTAQVAEPAPAAQPGPIALFIAFRRAQLAAAGFARHEAEIAGHRTVWWEKGEGATLVLVHGVADQAGTWFQVAPALAETHRVLLIDLPGHGESEPAEGPLPMTTVIEGFEAWLAAPAVAVGASTGPILIGNSMGAWVALLAALRHPERVGRVVAVNGGGLRADTGGLDLLPDDREEARRLMAALRDPASPPIPDLVLDDLVRRVETGEARRMFQANQDLESYLLDESLDVIATPVDVLWGESDRYLGRDYPARLLAGLPNARLTWIEHCGHLPQAECPERFLERLREVLALAPPAAPEAPAGAAPYAEPPAAPVTPEVPAAAPPAEPGDAG